MFIFIQSMSQTLLVHVAKKVKIHWVVTPVRHCASSLFLEANSNQG